MWYAIEKTIKTWALHRLERRLPERILTPDEVDWSKIRRILAVRQHDQFGDFLLTTPALRALRRRFPDAEMTLVVRDFLLPAAAHNPDVDEVLVFHESAGRWTPQASFEFVRRLRRRFDLAVVFNTVSHSMSSDLIAFGSRAPLVLGPAAPTFDHLARNPFYNLIAPYDPAPKHQIHRNLDIVRYIGADTRDYTYGFALTREEIEKGRRIREDLGLAARRRVIAVHFGTKDRRKQYPIPQLAGLCDRLAETNETRILVIRAPDEDARLDELRRRLRHPVTVAPLLDLREVAALLYELPLLVCNDTGVLHLAAAVRTPTVSFHAASDPAFWKPIGDRHIALYAENGDIASIRVEQALEAIRKALA